MKRTEWVAPVFIVLAIFAIWMSLNYLPPDIFGSEWSAFATGLWQYMPWLLAFAVGLYVFKMLVDRR